MIIFDTETTGLIENIAIPVKRQPQIIELYALKIDDDEIDATRFESEGDAEIHDLIEKGTHWHSLFFAKNVSDEITRITGIKTSDLVNAPTFAERFDDLASFFAGERVLVGQNLSFDRDMLSIELRRLGKQCAFPWPWVHMDTVEITEGDEGYRLNLTALHTKLFGVGFSSAHRAKADVEATARVTLKLMAQGRIQL